MDNSTNTDDPCGSNLELHVEIADNDNFDDTASTHDLGTNSLHAQNTAVNNLMHTSHSSSQTLEGVLSKLGKLDNICNKLERLEMKMYSMESQIKEIKNPDPEIMFNHSAQQARTYSHAGVTNTGNNGLFDNAQNNFTQNAGPNFSLYPWSSQNVATNQISQNMDNSSSGKSSMKMKPQNYNGLDDLEDFLTQFELTSEINGSGLSGKIFIFG